jgi:hypothetical protein
MEGLLLHLKILNKTIAITQAMPITMEVEIDGKRRVGVEAPTTCRSLLLCQNPVNQNPCCNHQFNPCLHSKTKIL